MNIELRASTSHPEKIEAAVCKTITKHKTQNVQVCKFVEEFCWILSFKYFFSRKVFAVCAIYLVAVNSSPVPEPKPEPQVLLTHPGLVPWGGIWPGSPLVLGHPGVISSPLIIGPSGVIVANPPEVVQINA